MLITNAKKEDNGNWNFDLDLREDEVDFLVNFATQILLSEGLLSIKEQQDLQEVDLPKEGVAGDNTPKQNAPTSNCVN